jgi:putative tryptophan/tyrosine transport system substrate-binding protein
MNRRRFIAAIAGGVFARPLHAAVEQSTKIYRIGWLDLGPTRRLEEFRAGLSKLGWIEGRNITIEGRFADNNPGRLAALATELVELKVDVIVTASTPAALAAKEATTVIPIVMAGSSHPVERGLVSNLARPGENITGLTHNPGAGFHQKLIQLLKEAAPKASRVAILWSSGEDAVLKEVQAAAPTLGITILDAGPREPAGVMVALGVASRAGADALLVTPSSLNTSHRKTIVDFALAHRLPSIYGDTSFVRAGGLMSYWTDWDEVRRRSATYVDKILKGAKPGDLPIEQPTKFELVINVKTAKAIGLAIPKSLLLRADEVIR